MAQYFYRGVNSGLIYQYWVGPQGLDALPTGFTDPFGNVLELVRSYDSPDGLVEDLVLCLGYGGVRNGTNGPPSPPDIYQPGHIFSPWEQVEDPGVD